MRLNCRVSDPNMTAYTVTKVGSLLQDIYNLLFYFTRAKRNTQIHGEAKYTVP